VKGAAGSSFKSRLVTEVDGLADKGVVRTRFRGAFYYSADGPFFPLFMCQPLSARSPDWDAEARAGSSARRIFASWVVSRFWPRDHCGERKPVGAILLETSKWAD